MKKKSKRIIITTIIVIFLIILGVLLFQKKEAALTSKERAWISENQKNIQNVSVTNSSNIFGKDGVGIYYEFLNSLTEKYNIKFNKITTEEDNAINNISLMVGNNMPQTSFLFYEDHYVLVSKNEDNITDTKSINNKTIGVLSKNETYVKNYLTDLNITYKSYQDDKALLSAMDKNEISYLLVPRTEYMDTILQKKYWINYHFSDILRYFYVADKEDEELYTIFKKYFNTWQTKNLDNVLYKEERNLFANNLGISETDLDKIQKDTINYAYKVNAPYEIYGDNKYGGVISEYLTRFSKFAGIEIKYTKYTSDKKIIRDLNNDKIDLLTSFYNNINDNNVIKTNMPIKIGVFVNEKNNTIINSIEALKKVPIYVEENSIILDKLSNLGLETNTFKLNKIASILKNKDNIILMDEAMGRNLQKSTLSNYELQYTYNTSSTYTMNSYSDETINTLLKRYINFLDNNVMLKIGTYNGTKLSKKGAFINSFASYLIFAFIVIVVILLLIYRSSKKVKIQKKIKKEDKLKYVDHLTSLKNRNYLNENMTSWSKNTIYPQSVIIIDLNKVQEINDTEGYEEGDKQIKSAANILIKTQLDNSDLIRTNGNEFMIYLVGYSQKQVTSYLHKLTKEFNNLPYKNGVCLSYSMILDDLKSIEDAINECVEEIKKQKTIKEENV